MRFYICVSEVPSFLDRAVCTANVHQRETRDCVPLGAGLVNVLQPKCVCRAFGYNEAIQDGGQIYSLKWDKGRGGKGGPVLLQSPAFPLGLARLSPPILWGLQSSAVCFRKAKALGFLAIPSWANCTGILPSTYPLPEQCVIQQTGSTCQIQESP